MKKNLAGRWIFLAHTRQLDVDERKRGKKLRYAERSFSELRELRITQSAENSANSASGPEFTAQT